MLQASKTIMRRVTFSLIVSSLLLPLASCDREVPVNIDVVTHMSVTDTNGLDLLNPVNAGSFKKEGIKLYYVENGVLKEVYNSSYTWPRNFDVQKNDLGEYAMVVVPDIAGENGTVTKTVIDWDGIDKDTLETELIKFKTEVSVVSIQKIWFNKKLLYDAAVDGRSPWGIGTVDRLIQIKK